MGRTKEMLESYNNIDEQILLKIQEEYYYNMELYDENSYVDLKKDNRENKS